MLKLTLKVTAGVLGALPALVSATPVYVEYDVNVADYCNCEGTGYDPGERLAGWLKIDTDRAPPDYFGGEGQPPNQVHAVYWGPGNDFISGFGRAFRNPLVEVGDQIDVLDDSARFGFQGYSVWDYSSDQPGRTSFKLSVSSEDRVDDFIHGTGLEQSFDTEELKGNFRFVGVLTQELRGVRRNISLVLNRMSVTPGHCRAPD